METKVLKTLAYEEIKQQVAGQTVSVIGQETAKKMQPTSDTEILKKWQQETFDALDLLRLKGGMPVAQLTDIKPLLKRLDIEAYLNGQELAQISRVLSTAGDITKFFEVLADDEVTLQILYQLADKLVTLPDLQKVLAKSVADDGRILDSASQQLATLRSQIHRGEGKIREKLDSLIRGKNARYLSDPIITMRNDRYVIPVKAEYRSHFGGVVHDQSATGQTLFIEPQSVLDLNNQLRQLQAAEKQEIQRILMTLSDELRPFTQDLAQNAYVLGQLDFIQARAKYGLSLKGTMPILSENEHVVLKNARHPLIDPKKVVANDITIGGAYKTVVITGPNTGGKTITLKTLGLLQLMGQSGLPIPAAEESQIGIFMNIFADIGDEQSIEQNLSTFSSHMTNIVEMVKKTNERTLLLFDELGAGTDPQEGAALAIAILDAVAAKGAIVMATTHYPELKAYGYNRPETINASMAFDVESLQPTYQLLMGVPGRSNAFEISKRLGLDDTIIQAASSLIDEDSQDLNEMILDLENKQKAADQIYTDYQNKLQTTEKLQQDLTAEYDFYQQEKDKALDDAREKANQLVNEAEERADQIIHDIREKQKMIGQHSIVKEHELIDAKTQLQNLHVDEQLKKNKVLKKAKAKQQLKAGDEVLVHSYGQRGVLIEESGDDKWQVQLGILKMRLPESDLEKINAVPEKETKRMISTVRSAGTSHVSPQLDLRGKRYEDAIEETDRYIDAALLAGYPQVTIVHGKGTGALREGITNYLKNHRSVKSFAYAPANQGGNGATIVEFK